MINDSYKWPRPLGFTPFDHQRETANFLTDNSRAFCFNEQGTGKTASVIWAADYLMKAGMIKRVLVVCPLSIMQSAWQNDLFKFAVHRTVDVAYGSAEKRNKVANSTAEFVIINYDGLPAIAESAINSKMFDLVVIDEANAYKNVQTKRWKLMRKLITPDTWLWMLTGTPAAQSPVDAYGLCKLCVPQRAPRFFGDYRESVMQALGPFRWIPRPNSEKIVFEMLQPAIRFEKSQCLDLPDVMYQTREIPLTPQVQKYYKMLKDQMMIEAAGTQISAVNAAAGLNKLLQISGGAVYTDDKGVLEFDIQPRLSALMEVIEETENKVIIFVPYRHTIEVVSRYLTDKNISIEIIQGSVSATQRANIINQFQSMENPRVLVIQPQSASHGVTLTRADTVVFWSPVMSVETYLQCIARMDRVGQVNKMTVVHLQGSEVERKMYAMLQGKVDLHTKLVDLYREELGT